MIRVVVHRRPETVRRTRPPRLLVQVLERLDVEHPGPTPAKELPHPRLRNDSLTNLRQLFSGRAERLDLHLDLGLGLATLDRSVGHGSRSALSVADAAWADRAVSMISPSSSYADHRGLPPPSTTAPHRHARVSRRATVRQAAGPERHELVALFAAGLPQHRLCLDTIDAHVRLQLSIRSLVVDPPGEIIPDAHPPESLSRRRRPRRTLTPRDIAAQNDRPNDVATAGDHGA